MSTCRYVVETIDHKPLTARLNTARLKGPLKVIPAPYEQSKGFRASSLHDCMRQTGYRLTGAKQTHDTYNVDYSLSADLGTACHQRIQEQLVDCGLAVEIHGKPAIEIIVRHGELSGHVDAIIRPRSGVLTILDIKTTGPKEFAPGYKYLADKWAKWSTQLHVYMAYFAMPDGEQAREALVLHINRGDTSERKLYRIAWQPAVWALDEARLEVAQAAIAMGELPMAEPGACRFCSWRGLCDENDWKD